MAMKARPTGTLASSIFSATFDLTLHPHLHYSLCAVVAMLGMSIFGVAILSTSLKKLFDVKRLTASLVSSTLRAANCRFVCVPAGNTFVIQSSIPQKSVGIAPPVTGKCNTTSVRR
ncbi:hypothetical protein EV421DRAFT_1910156 [Armillaria borealis]|uniref:Uncharacterized protein n=1 Tax=Armillaria borealis TaxID=47425 RepID=A0AA39MGC8_9AGAR|nr:hypothetical protein EV421DRAFT_1910156 [Armillaria borealis]